MPINLDYQGNDDNAVDQLAELAGVPAPAVGSVENRIRSLAVTGGVDVSAVAESDRNLLDRIAAGWAAVVLCLVGLGDSIVAVLGAGWTAFTIDGQTGTATQAGENDDFAMSTDITGFALPAAGVRIYEWVVDALTITGNHGLKWTISNPAGAHFVELFFSEPGVIRRARVYDGVTIADVAIGSALVAGQRLALGIGSDGTVSAWFGNTKLTDAGGMFDTAAAGLFAGLSYALTVQAQFTTATGDTITTTLNSDASQWGGAYDGAVDHCAG